MKKPTEEYTLVQHSAWVVKRDPDFKHAVEECLIPNTARLCRIYNENGLILNSFNKAYKKAFEVNYPPEVSGVIPHAKGTFSQRVKIGDAHVYIPEKK